MKPVGQGIGTEPAARVGPGVRAAWLPAVVAALVCVQIVTEVAQISTPMASTVLSWVIRVLVAAALVAATAGMARGRRAGLAVGLAALGVVLSVQVITLSQPVRLLLFLGDVAVTDWLPSMLVSLLIVTAAGAAAAVTIAPAAARHHGPAIPAGVPPASPPGVPPGVSPRGTGTGTARPSRSVAAAITLVASLVLAFLSEATYLLAVLGSLTSGMAPAHDPLPTPPVLVEVPLPAANLVLATAALVLIPWLWRGVGWARLLALVVAGAHVLAIGGLLGHGITGGVMTVTAAEVDGFVRWIIRPIETITAALTIALLAKNLRRTL